MHAVLYFKIHYFFPLGCFLAISWMDRCTYRRVRTHIFTQVISHAAKTSKEQL
jgi:hypothetical protein